MSKERTAKKESAMSGGRSKTEPRPTQATPARMLALKVTRQVRERKAYAHELIERQVWTAAFPAAERDFATLLIRGVVATSGELDVLLRRVLTKGRIKPEVRDALRISVFEMMFLGKEPRVAVHQGVELVRSISPRATGFANKLLNDIAKLKDDFPFGDPATSVEALAHAQAFPLWLAERLDTELGFERASAFMEASNIPAPLFLANLASGETVQARAAQLPDFLPGIEKGELIVADASAQAIARLATPLQGTPFLEVGSGRGTKTVLLQHNALREGGGQAKLYALDLHPFKQGILEERVSQYGLENVVPVTGDVLTLDSLIAEGSLPSGFSGSLIDAPCSGTGTLRRNPEIRWRLAPEEVTAMAQQGLAMLKAVAPHIEKGGFVVYATCSVLIEENEAVIEAFLASEEGEGYVLALPSPYLRSALTPGSPDAHFAAKLVRRGDR